MLYILHLEKRQSIILKLEVCSDLFNKKWLRLSQILPKIVITFKVLNYFDMTINLLITYWMYI